MNCGRPIGPLTHHASVVLLLCSTTSPQYQIIDEEATKKRQEEADKAIKEGEDKPKVRLREAGWQQQQPCAVLLPTLAPTGVGCQAVCCTGQHNVACRPCLHSVFPACADEAVWVVLNMLLRLLCSPNPKSTTVHQVEPVMKTDYEDVWDWRVENDNKPLWTRNPKEVAEADYNEFFKQVCCEGVLTWFDLGLT
jgi:hypothetical protein